jgi:DNA adenine methylase
MNDAVRRKRIRPLVKWTGGKFDEFSLFKKFIPKFTNYYEPFFGGGGVFFALEPKGMCFINDVSKDLINFYQLFSSAKFHKQLYAYVDAWEELELLAQFLIPFLLPIFAKDDYKRVANAIDKAVTLISPIDYSSVFHSHILATEHALKKQLYLSLSRKYKRVRAICSKECCYFSEDKLKIQIETAVRCAFYNCCRCIMNQYRSNKLSLSKEQAAANWYFIREFCYGSMFRYNRAGAFNIPYGGATYNKKDLRRKVAHVCSKKAQQLLSKTHISCQDFEQFLNHRQVARTDFIFLDPPYDEAFCAYDDQPFTQGDHVRLQNVLRKMSCKWMLIIKNTPFIQGLYSTHTYTITSYHKLYSHNISGRNNRSTEHLIIMNYVPLAISSK